jgi:hypothetical protein
MPPVRFLTPADPQMAVRALRLAPFLDHGDPLADRAVEAIALRAPDRRGSAELIDRALSPGGWKDADVPAELRVLVETARHLPAWLDEAAAQRGGDIVTRTGVVGGIVLGLKSLVSGYASPGGNKPLVFSGRLKEQATSRLNETSRFVQATCAPGTLAPDGAGWRITLKVRLMHAQVRRLILASGRWDAATWGSPINQHDMAATALLFSQVFVDGVRQLGAQVTAEEADDVLHLWRWSAHLIGVDPELQVDSERAAKRLSDLIVVTQTKPDDDSRALTSALLHSGETNTRPEVRKAPSDVGYAICRFLLGDELAEQLAVPRSRFELAVPLAMRAVQVAERVRRTLPSGDASALDRGRRYWQRVVDFGFHDASSEFQLPHALGGSVGGQSPVA